MAVTVMDSRLLSYCHRFDLFKISVAIMVCRRFGLSPFRRVAVLTVAVSVCRRFDSPPCEVIYECVCYYLYLFMKGREVPTANSPSIH